MGQGHYIGHGIFAGSKDLINIRYQYELYQEYRCITCPAILLIAEERIVEGCERDLLTTVSQVILKYLSNPIIAYGDILDIKNGEVLFYSCGFAPYSLAKVWRRLT